MKRSTMMATMAVAVLTLSSSLALAKGRWGGGGPGRGMGQGQGQGQGPRGMMGKRLGQMLELTESQRDQIHALRDQMRSATAETREALKQKREEMHALWTQEVPNRNAILNKSAEMDALRKTMQVARIDFRLSVHALLTPEQRAKLAELPPPGRRGRHRPGGPGGPGGGFGGGFGPGGPWGDGGDGDF